MAFIFGYGSLLFRPDFPHAPPRVATAYGWMRRLDQCSPDHRGTPECLGRVATLVSQNEATCTGAVFEIAREHEAPVLAALDHRERGGYVRQDLNVVLRDTGESVAATTWIARMDNPFYLGPAPLDAMVSQIARAVGPSGANTEYVLRLAEILRAWGIDDQHIFEIAARLCITV